MTAPDCADGCVYGTCNGWGEYGPCGGCCKCAGGCLVESMTGPRYKWIGACSCNGQDLACTLIDANWEIDNG